MEKKTRSSAKKSKFKSFIWLYIALVVVGIIVSLFFLPSREEHREALLQAETEEVPETAIPTQAKPTSHYIEGVPVIAQYDLMAGCETYACTMLLQSLGFDIDEYRFADNYLITKDVYFDNDFNRYGPDMYSAFAGDVYHVGYGIYAPAMAKSMNSFFGSVKSDKKATALEGVPLETLCEEYIDNDIPVMVWATTNMWEPTENTSWTVVYTDENAKAKMGDTVWWYEHEHCLVLIGYDEKEYFFADSVAGEVSHFEKELVAKRYKQIGTQAIVVQ